MADTFLVQLRRMETSQPWGFRLRGGTDQGMPLFVEHVRTISSPVMGVLLLKHRIFIDPAAASIQLFIRRSDKYLVLPGPAIYPAAVLNGFSRTCLHPRVAINIPAK